MESELPEDLAEVDRWATAAIKAAWELYGLHHTGQIGAPRSDLIKLLLAPPRISAALNRELMEASDQYQRENPACIAGIPARHPLDAIQELCWQVLESAHRQSQAPIHLQIALHKDLREMDRPTRESYSQWVAAARAIDEVQQDRTKLRQLLPDINAAVNESSASAQPLMAPGAPAPRKVPCPGDELEVLLHKVLNRVWNTRLKQQAGDQGEPATTRSSAGARLTKGRRPGRPSKTKAAADAQIAKGWRDREPGLRTFAEYARECGGNLTAEQVERAVDRHRHRQPPPK